MKQTDFKAKILIVFIILVLVLGIDQWTKVLAVEYLKGTPTRYYFGGLFQLLYAENPGAFLGMGGGWTREVRFVVFGLVVVLGLGFMLWSLLKNKISSNELWAYSFILAGGIGNVIDRLTHANGHVVDFLFVELGFTRTGVFNVADMAIVLGVLIALAPSIIRGLKSKNSPQKPSAT